MQIINILPNNLIGPDMPRQEYELYLAGQILKEPDKYSFLQDDINSYKILDNSACELGKGLEIEQLLEAAKIIGADEIVLPDILKSNESLDYSLECMSKIPSNFKQKIALVIQGVDFGELVINAKKAKKIKQIDTIMLPKWSKHCRTLLTELISDSDKEIHWLGMGTSLRELLEPIASLVRTMDTGYYTALAAGDYGLTLFEDRKDDIDINLDYMNVNIEKLNDFIRQQNEFFGGVR